MAVSENLAAVPMSQIAKTAAVLESSEHRDMLDVIDTLRSQGISRYVDLPQIIVCGDQSSGKSSVLEAISRVDFPTKDGLCTRFATELILRRSETEDLRIYIVPGPDRNDKEKESLSSVRFMADFSSIGDAIEQAKSSMEAAGNQGTNFFSDTLRVEISGPDQPHLTMVDLPGLFLASNKAQSYSDAEMVKKMVLSYMKKPRSIILAVVSASNEFVLQQVTQLAREIDPSGKRTLGLITKPDKLDQGSETEQYYVQLAQNTNVKLTLGWHVLRNRSYAESMATSRERDNREASFFQGAPWDALPTGHKGIAALRSRLSTILRDQILSQLPSVISDVKTGLKESETQLDRLGSARATITDQRSYLLMCSQEFTSLIRQATEGHYFHTFFQGKLGETMDATRLRAVVQQRLTHFATHMQTNGKKEQIIDARESDEMQQGQISRSFYLDKVRFIMENCRGKELAGMFNPAVVSQLFRQQSEPWEAIAQTAMKDIVASAQATVDAALSATTERFRDSIESALRAAIPNINFSNGPQPLLVDPRALLNNIAAESEPSMDKYTCQLAVDTMEAYYKVALKKFIDDFSVDAVEMCLIKKLPGVFSLEVVSRLDDADILRLASESDSAIEQREELLEKKKVLESALEALHRISVVRS
ncbi:uncharacterized protein JN550_003122 [Neoarthrinium moseri]|uniref:uncharacterized protein n=1 Tax=Neoarthrinium moseri TaxID=1658444 RepID=UPI001FDD60CD|nr:uncharacterized protein JN550_003122 [Neoarthrinium moseri]KAI1873853.1 hypothetical protein JN550_003122 [Neoarthrinium moseri]